MKTKILRGILYTVIGSLISAVGLYYFVYPSSFAPTGIDGIATMIQDLSQGKISASVTTFVINLPLLILALIFLDKKFSVYTILSTVTLSLFIFLLQTIKINGEHLPQYTDVSTTNILPAIFSGVFIGIRTGLVLKVGGSSGGVDIVAAIIQKKNPHVNIEKYIAFFCYVIIGTSFFVYAGLGNNLNVGLSSVMLSIIQMFVFQKTIEFLMRSSRNAVEFKIITKDTTILKEEILSVIKHGATVVSSKGMFTDEEKDMIFCVVNTRQVPEFMKILKKHNDLFVYCTNVSSVNGNFRWNRDDIVK